MRSQFVGPAVGLVSAAIAARFFLQWSGLVAERLPLLLVSGSYNSILLLLGGCFGVLLYRLLGRGGAPTSDANGGLRLDTRHMMRVLAVVAASLIWVNVFDYLVKRAADYQYRMVMPLFALEMEGNLPTFFSAFLLLACALLLALVARATPREEPGRWHWLGLAWIIGFLAFDEFSGLHERLVPLGRSLLSGEGPFDREWVFVYGALLIPIGLVFLPFLYRLPSPTRRAWLLAGAVFLAGAVGLELLTGWYGIRESGYTPMRACLNICKETLEMAGALIFLRSLLDYVEREVGLVGVSPARASRPS